jgi:hypothetical protein
MIKEIFEIEPIQKNSLIIFIGILFLSFLQLYIFKHNIFEEGIFVTVGISLSFSICWIILNILSVFIFFNYISGENDKSELFYDKIIFLFGLLILFWISLLTYIGYELELSLKDFLRMSIMVCFIRTFFWFVLDSLPKKKKNKNSD